MHERDQFILDRTGVVELDDGGRVVVRPIVPDDKSALQEGLAALSPQSRYLRFFTDVSRLSARDLRYLTEIDYDNHFAWVAMAEEPDGPGTGVGVGRYIRLEGEPEVAEAAIVVVDAWQHRGVGGALLSLLAQSAVEHGIRTFRTYVLAENAELVDRMRRESVSVRLTGETYEVDVTLPLEQPSGAARHVLEQVARLDAAG